MSYQILEGKTTNVTPQAYQNSTSTGGIQMKDTFSAPSQITGLLVKFWVTTSGSTGTGTSAISELIQRLRITPGVPANLAGAKVVADFDNRTLPYAAIALQMARKPALAPGITLIDTVAAGNATYYGQYFTPIMLPPGQYSWFVDMNPASVLAGYSPVPSGLNLNVAIQAICDTTGGDQGFATTKIHAYTLASPSVFIISGQSGGVDAYALMTAASAELSAKISTIQDTIDSLAATAIIAEEDLFNMKSTNLFAVSTASGSGANFTKPIQDPKNVGASNPLYGILRQLPHGTSKVTTSAAATFIIIELEGDL